MEAMTYTEALCQATRTPESRAAVSLSPIAYRYRPARVRERYKCIATTDATKRRAGTGTYGTSAPAIARTDSGAPRGPKPRGVAGPPLTYRATPRAALIVASVAMKGWSRQRATARPLTAPQK